MKVGFISLGCSKNLVDTEMMIGLFKENKFKIVNNPEEADIIIINTCGFIESAKKEAIDTILEMAEYKKSNCKLLIVTGCLIERYKDELIKEMPEVDLFIKFSEYKTFWEQIEKLIETKMGKKCSENKEKSNKTDIKKSNKDKELFNKSEGDNFDRNKEISSKLEEKHKNRVKEDKKQELDFLNRVVTTGLNYAYIRIAEGCDNFCTFCAIPYIRGRYTSRKEEDILEEIKELAKSRNKRIYNNRSRYNKIWRRHLWKAKACRLIT